MNEEEGRKEGRKRGGRKPSGEYQRVNISYLRVSIVLSFLLPYLLPSNFSSLSYLQSGREGESEGVQDEKQRLDTN